MADSSVLFDLFVATGHVNSFGSDYNERQKLQTFKVEDVEDLPDLLRKDQAPMMPSLTHSEGEETHMTLAELLNALPRSARLTITPEFEIATRRTLVVSA